MMDYEDDEQAAEQAHVDAEITKRRQQDLDEAVSFVISDPRGRAFLWEVLSRTRLFSASMTGDAMTTAFNEGRRDIGINLFAEALTLRPRVFSEMQDEHATRAMRYHVIPRNQENNT